MNRLPPKMQMLAILGATRAIVAQSQREGWGANEPIRCVAVLDQMMAHIIDPEQHDVPEYASNQFAPTGPVQEIAISNGWQDAYIHLSSEYDRLENRLALFRAE